MLPSFNGNLYRKPSPSTNQKSQQSNKFHPIPVQVLQRMYITEISRELLQNSRTKSRDKGKQGPTRGS